MNATNLVSSATIDEYMKQYVAGDLEYQAELTPEAHRSLLNLFSAGSFESDGITIFYCDLDDERHYFLEDGTPWVALRHRRWQRWLESFDVAAEALGARFERWVLSRDWKAIERRVNFCCSGAVLLAFCWIAWAILVACCTSPTLREVLR